MNMNYAISAHVAYLLVSVVLTVWVARTLFRNGRIFLVDAMAGNELLADSINKLLVVGFYLINVGYIAVALQEGRKAGDLLGVIETVSYKVGVVTLILGAMHFLNLGIISRARTRTQEKAAAERRFTAAQGVKAGDRDTRANVTEELPGNSAVLSQIV